jgi:membrane associated rhomboid family serine protease
MLENRDYMRGNPFDTRRSVTVTILIVNVVVFLLQLISSQLFSRFPIYYYFALSVDGIQHGFVWQLFTYQVMHGGWLHLLLNCWVIYVFGREVEETLGRARFLTLYVSSGVIGGVLQVLFGLVSEWFARPVVGASAGGFGLIAAFATLYPERPLMLLLFFIIPVNMRAKFLLLFSGIIALIGIAFPSSGGNIAHVAHLGGMLTGIAFIRYAQNWNWNWRWPRFGRSRPQKPRRLLKVRLEKPGLWGRANGNAPEDLPPEEFVSKEVDPILDKISAKGIHSLTERERRILEAARAKMAKR